MSEPQASGELGALELLTRADMQIEGRMPWSSNATFLVDLCHEGATAKAVYKPERGERPLHDFPGGLGRREEAAYLLSEALGWGLVPPTIQRDGPLGEGSVQLFVPADFEQHYFTLHEDPVHHDALRAICAFDLVANNTDRKSGHCLLGLDGRIHAIDNGLSFHAEFKLRTVIWEFAAEAIPEPLLDDLAALVEQGLPKPLASLLDPFERDALLTRAGALLRARRFPTDPTGRRYPWPLV
ncbi:SCO1664 family protein [soil metagenome]